MTQPGFFLLSLSLYSWMLSVEKKVIGHWDKRSGRDWLAGGGRGGQPACRQVGEA